MVEKRKPALSISWPAVPEKPNASDLVVAMGRLAIAWSSSEHYLVLALYRLLSDQADVERQILNKATHNAAFALFYAVESSRGRRKLVHDLADVRAGEHVLSKAANAELKALLERAQPAWYEA